MACAIYAVWEVRLKVGLIMYTQVGTNKLHYQIKLLISNKILYKGDLPLWV